MKRVLSVILLIVFLSGCASQTPPSSATEPAESSSLTGNVFLDAEEKSYSLEGGGWSRVETVSKEDALAASASDYADFVSERLPSFRAELFGLIFDDGTGITYYGCDPSNAVYGTVTYRGTSVEAYGFIVPNEDGSYSYVPYSDDSVDQPDGVEMTIDFSFGPRSGIYSGDLDGDGLPNGQGTFQCQDAGWSFTGKWDSGHWNSTGVTMWDDGTTYDGEYQNDIISGTGVYTFTDGTTISGVFADGVPSGDCTLLWPDGTSFIGEFTDFFNATGSIQNETGKTLAADIVDGELVVKD